MAYKDIYDIPIEFIELEKMLDDEEIDEEEYKQIIEDLIEKSSKDLASARAFYLHLGNKLDIIKKEQDRLKSLKASTEKTIDSIKGIFKLILERNDGKKVQTDIGYISGRKSKSVKILDENKIADEYKTKKIEVAISKTLIKTAIEKGEIVDGAELSDNLSIIVK